MSALAEEANWPRATLDRDYSAQGSVTAEIFNDEMHNYRSRSDAVRAEWIAHADVVYDAASGQTMDIFGAGDEPRPVFLFIHGGYWRMLSKLDSAFMAAMLARHGVATAVVDYRLSPQAGLDEIVREVRAAAAFLWKDGRRHGIDPHRIHAGGSSAGGHLTGTLLAGGWHDEFGVPEDVVKSAMPISGLFHLAPIARCFPQDWLALSEAQVEALSPAANLPRAGCPIVVAHAETEAAGFKRQSAEFHRLWRAAGFASTLVEIPHRNHFDVPLDLARDDTELSRRLLGLIHGDG